MSQKELYIYVMRCGNRIKIGFSNDPESRRKTLQTGNPDEVIVEWTRQRDDAKKLEHHLHRKFRKFCVGGEWFDADKLELNKIISACFMFTDHDW